MKNRLCEKKNQNLILLVFFFFFCLIDTQIDEPVSLCMDLISKRTNKQNSVILFVRNLVLTQVIFGYLDFKVILDERVSH